MQIKKTCRIGTKEMIKISFKIEDFIKNNGQTKSIDVINEMKRKEEKISERSIYNILNILVENKRIKKMNEDVRFPTYISKDYERLKLDPNYRIEMESKKIFEELKWEFLLNYYIFDEGKRITDYIFTCKSDFIRDKFIDINMKIKLICIFNSSNIVLDRYNCQFMENFPLIPSNNFLPLMRIYDSSEIREQFPNLSKKVKSGNKEELYKQFDQLIYISREKMCELENSKSLPASKEHMKHCSDMIANELYYDMEGEINDKIRNYLIKNKTTLYSELFFPMLITDKKISIVDNGNIKEVGSVLLFYDSDKCKTSDTLKGESFPIIITTLDNLEECIKNINNIMNKNESVYKKSSFIGGATQKLVFSIKSSYESLRSFNGGEYSTEELTEQDKKEIERQTGLYTGKNKMKKK